MVRTGEIVGVAGVEGSGQFELCEAIMGIRPLASGVIRLGGRDITELSAKETRGSGIGYIPFDRHREGLMLSAPLWENALLGRETEPKFRSGPFVNAAAVRADTRDIITTFGVRTPNETVPAFALSGGNQQKLIVGRELESDPSVLIAAHPTRGVDVGAQATIWDELRQARDAGTGILLISADLDEVLALSDVILVMYDGRIIASLKPAEATPQVLGTLHDRRRAGGGLMDRAGRQRLAVHGAQLRGGGHHRVPPRRHPAAGHRSQRARASTARCSSTAPGRSSCSDAAKRAGPLIISGCAVAIGFKMNLFNIGVEGQMTGRAARRRGGRRRGRPAGGPARRRSSSWSRCAFGGFWAWIPAVLKVRRGVNEVISTIMLNAIAVGVTAWLYNTYFRYQKVDASGRPSLDVKTKPLPESAWLNNFVTSGSAGLSLYFVVALLIAVLVWLLIFRSTFGFQLRSSGLNPVAAQTAGIESSKMIVRAMLISGALAGIIGLQAILVDEHSYRPGLAAGLGFAGIAVALLGSQPPRRHRPRRVAVRLPAGVLWRPATPGRAEVDRRHHPGHRRADRRHRERRGRPVAGQADR